MIDNSMTGTKQINIDPNTLQDITCDNKAGDRSCNNSYFKQAFKMKRISAIQSPTGQEQLITIPVFQCTKCEQELNTSELQA
jgi:hypothetical protein